MRLKTRESGLLYQLSKITKSKLNTLVRKSIARQRITLLILSIPVGIFIDFLTVDN